MPNEMQENLVDVAYERFQKASEDIEHVKEGIAKTKTGEATLASIQKEPDRLASRIAREGTSIKEALERINGAPNFQDILVLKKLLALSQSVCRITIKTKYGTSGFGTGFLIAPGLIITNHHVFPDVETAKDSLVQFGYELDEAKRSSTVQTFNLKPENFFITSSVNKVKGEAYSGLDFSIVAVDKMSKEGKNINSIPFSRLDNAKGKILEGENCIVIQHPKGDYKKVVLKDIRMLTLTEDFLIYESDTLPGSSGAMVIGMGTGEILALHHSGVPRKNEQGQWLRKDGGVYQDSDPDEAIDWIGNEGIRVSSLVHAVKKMTIPERMKPLRNSILGLSPNEKVNENDELNPSLVTGTSNILQTAENITQPPSITPMPQEIPQQSAPVVAQSIQLLTDHNDYSGGSATCYFELELVDNKDMQDDWHSNYSKLVQGAVISERVFPFSTDPFQKRFVYLTMQSDENPWDLAAKIEALPQVNAATPDLPMATDMQLQQTKKQQNRFESDLSDVYSDGTAMWNESDFIKNWNDQMTIFGYRGSEDGQDVKVMRSWNRNMVKINKVKFTDDLCNEIMKIKLVQLDTGYTDHSKVRGGFNLECDEDFLDGEDARDEQNAGLFLYPGHGSRTASIVIGRKDSGITETVMEGNSGLLYNEHLKDFRLIPYRISPSVILINRAKNVADGVVQAINNNADVIFMCMGSYPTPMLYAVAKEAYERGVIWVCAAGNQVKSVIAPALYPGTIAVAAVNPAYRPWKGSSYGNAVDIAAPGEDVYVPFYDKQFKEIMVYGDGTSYATPHVASAAVLWKAKNAAAIKEKYKEPWMVVEAFRKSIKQSVLKEKITGNKWEVHALDLPADYFIGIFNNKQLLNYKAEIVNRKWKVEPFSLPSGYGGILNIEQLLDCPLPEIEPQEHAYYHMPDRIESDLGFRETAYFLWQTLVKNIKSATESTTAEMILTERARICVSALSGSTASSVFESYNNEGQLNATKILNNYFETYQQGNK